MADQDFLSYILELTQSKKVLSTEKVQELWSGYGEILRVDLQDRTPIILKYIQWPDTVSHPRGWVSDLSHARKVNSYQVEVAFYQQYAHLTNECRVPTYLGASHSEQSIMLVLEDLNASGYPERLSQVGPTEIQSCLTWLAHFHASFINIEPNNLWPTGTYWHLDTRPDELEALADIALKHFAPQLDQALKNVPQTLVHGDAKLANFCFNHDGSEVAAVDFQYVGGGCGMKDVAYFIGSCLDESECEKYETELLDFYFSKLRPALTSRLDPNQIDHVESSWRSAFPLAWADFHRFLKGWSPGHWKINSYSETMCRKAIDQIKEEKLG